MSNVEVKGKVEGAKLATGGDGKSMGMAAPAVDGMGAVAAAGAPVKPQGLRYGDYKKHNLGYPVQEGQNWHDLTPNQRQQWFRNHEQRWKQRMNEKQQGRGGMQPSLSFGQG